MHYTQIKHKLNVRLFFWNHFEYFISIPIIPVCIILSVPTHPVTLDKIVLTLIDHKINVISACTNHFEYFISIPIIPVCIILSVPTHPVTLDKIVLTLIDHKINVISACTYMGPQSFIFLSYFFPHSMHELSFSWLITSCMFLISPVFILTIHIILCNMYFDFRLHQIMVLQSFSHHVYQ